MKFLSAAEQIYFQVIVLPEVLSLEHLYPAEAAELLLRMIKHQDLKLFAKNVLVHYVPQLSKAEDIEQGL